MSTAVAGGIAHRMSDPKAAYQAALAQHRERIAPALAQIDAAIDEVIAARRHGVGDPGALPALQTTRVLLVSGLFDSAFYLKRHPDIAKAGVDPLAHYVAHGDREGRWPNPAFDPAFYRRERRDALPEDRNTLEHYITEGERNGARASDMFDPRAYLAATPGFAEFVDRPLFHFLALGGGATAYLGAEPAAAHSGGPAELDPLSSEAYAASIAQHQARIAPRLRHIDEAITAAIGADDKAALDHLWTTRTILRSGLFEPDYYREKYPDLQNPEIDLLDHYVRHGDAEGRLPNPAFFPLYYRSRYMAGFPAAHNALQHYIEQGEQSGYRPNHVFEPQQYLDGNLLEFVNRPLFHFLNHGRYATAAMKAAPTQEMLDALDWIEEIANRGGNDQSLLMRAKRALVQALGLQLGFHLYRELISRPDHCEIHLKRLASLKDYCAQRAPTYHESSTGGEPFPLSAPTVVGDGEARAMVGITRSIFISCLIDARVRGGSAFIEVDDAVLLDYQGDELRRMDDQLDFDPAIFQASCEDAWVITPQGTEASVQIKEAFTLLGVRTDSFGHWLVEYLPKLVSASVSGALPRVPILVDADMPETHRQALQLMIPEGVEIIALQRFATARVRRLWCASAQGYFPIQEIYNERFRWEYLAVPPARFAAVAKEMVRRYDEIIKPRAGNDRVFLAREAHLGHQMTNRPAIEMQAANRGFLLVYPQQLVFTEQVRLARNARFIIGPSGSAICLARFAKPGTRLCVLAYIEDVPSVQAELTGVLDAIGVEATIFTGSCVRQDEEHPWYSDFEIDENAFGEFLDEWLEVEEHRYDVVQ